MSRLVETRVTELWRSRCPHCRVRAGSEEPMLVTIIRNNKGEVLSMIVTCDNEREGQDRT